MKRRNFLGGVFGAPVAIVLGKETGSGEVITPVEKAAKLIKPNARDFLPYPQELPPTMYQMRIRGSELIRILEQAKHHPYLTDEYKARADEQLKQLKQSTF